MNRHISKESTHMAKYYVLAVKEMEIKDNTLGLCFTLARIVMIKKTQPAWQSNTTGEEKHEYPVHNDMLSNWT